MKINKGDQMIDIKTGNSQMSDIDLFSKLQASFLQKFFKYNITDYFHQLFSNAYEDVFNRKVNKTQKGLLSSLYVANKQFSVVHQLQQKVDKFYKSKSKSFDQKQKQLSCAFKHLYCNLKENDCVIDQQQLILMDVKVKAEVQKIQEVPQKILKCLNAYKNSKKQNLTQFEQLLQNYDKKHFNVFFIYFGDINFSIFNKKLYQCQSVKILGKSYKFRIFVFYVSKQALIETFRTINKIENLNMINDLVIQFYELKRQKNRQKKIQNKTAYKIKGRKQEKKVVVVSQNNIQVKHIALGVIGVISLTVFGFTIKKMFF